MRTTTCLGLLGIVSSCVVACSGAPDADLQDENASALTAQTGGAEDSFVSTYSAGARGAYSYLKVGATADVTQRSYLKFQVSAIPTGATNVRATLKLYAQTTTTTDAVEAHLAKNTTWTESTLTLANEPGAQTALLARSSGTTSGAWTSFDVSSAVTQNGTVAFVLSVPSGAIVSFASKEAGAATAPSLNVTYDAPTQPASGKALLGMSSPDNLWAQRVSEVGPGLQARRLFFSDFNASLAKAQEACNDHMYPVLSFKTGNHSWAQVAAGNADAELRSLATRVAALSCDAFVAVHHEPAGDGTAADWSAMQVHALPIIGGPIGGKVKVGVIGNGWWWSGTNQGYTDAEIAAYVSPGVISVSDVIAADTYRRSLRQLPASVDIQRQSAQRRSTVKTGSPAIRRNASSDAAELSSAWLPGGAASK